MKYLLIVALIFSCATITFAQKTPTPAVMASAKKPVNKTTPAQVQMYLLSTRNKTTEISRAEFKKLKKKDIEYVKLLKDPVLLNMYGAKAKNGVTLVVMKDYSNGKKQKKQRQDSASKKPLATSKIKH